MKFVEDFRDIEAEDESVVSVFDGLLAFELIVLKGNNAPAFEE